MEKVSNWCDVLSGILQGQTYWRKRVLCRWKLPYTLGRVSWRIRQSAWIRNSIISRVCLILLISRVCLILLHKIDTGTVWRNSEMWNAWDIHHHHERDQCWQMIRRSSGQWQEYLSTLLLFYVLVRRNKVQEQQKSGKANWKTLRCIHHIKMQWESMEKQLNSSGKIPDFSILSILQERLDTEEHPTEGNRIIFVSVFNDILWKSDDRNCITNAEKVNDYAKQSLPGHWKFLGQGSETTWFRGSHEQQGH